ncbi:MAG: hypothetical protein RR385_09360 [Clostridiales bacterium]
MVVLSERQLQILRDLAPQVEEHVNSKDENIFFEALDDCIVDCLDDDQELLNKKGLMLQELYDDVFYSN